MTSEVDRLRAANGMQLGHWKPYIERRYGAQAWTALYGAINKGFGNAVMRAGLHVQFDDEHREVWRLWQLQHVEAAACEWLRSACRILDAKLNQTTEGKPGERA